MFLYAFHLSLALQNIQISRDFQKDYMYINNNYHKWLSSEPWWNEKTFSLQDFLLCQIHNLNLFHTPLLQIGNVLQEVKMYSLPKMH